MQGIEPERELLQGLELADGFQWELARQPLTRKVNFQDGVIGIAGDAVEPAEGLVGGPRGKDSGVRGLECSGEVEEDPELVGRGRRRGTTAGGEEEAEEGQWKRECTAPPRAAAGGHDGGWKMDGKVVGWKEELPGGSFFPTKEESSSSY